MRDLHSHLTTKSLNLIDPIRAKYHITSPLPPTTTTGSYPIDGIFVSPELMDIICGGWLELGEGYSDRRVLYFDVDMNKFLGKHKIVLQKKRFDDSSVMTQGLSIRSIPGWKVSNAWWDMKMQPDLSRWIRYLSKNVEMRITRTSTLNN